MNLPPLPALPWSTRRAALPPRPSGSPRPQRPARAAADAALALAPLAPAADEAPQRDDEARGCGWFDSSHELASGLLVTEHRQPDEIARLVPLGWWLAWELEAAAAPSVR